MKKRKLLKRRHSFFLIEGLRDLYAIENGRNQLPIAWNIKEVLTFRLYLIDYMVR